MAIGRWLMGTWFLPGSKTGRVTFIGNKPAMGLDKPRHIMCLRRMNKEGVRSVEYLEPFQPVTWQCHPFSRSMREAETVVCWQVCRFKPHC